MTGPGTVIRGENVTDGTGADRDVKATLVAGETLTLEKNTRVRCPAG